jgi:hypothetical protein
MNESQTNFKAFMYKLNKKLNIFALIRFEMHFNSFLRIVQYLVRAEYKGICLFLRTLKGHTHM